MQRMLTTLLETIDDNNIDKTLICARTTKQIMGLISQSDFCTELVSTWIFLDDDYI